MTNKLVRLDDGSASVIECLVEKEVNCGQTMNLQTESGLAGFLRHGVFCKIMMATAIEGDPSSAQCVAMGGNVDGCPRFGVLPNSQSTGQHEKAKKLLEIQKKIADSLTYSKMGNFSTVAGSDLANS